MVVPPLPDLTTLSHEQKDALIVALWEQVVSLKARLTALEQRLNEPPKTPDNSGVPPSKGQKANCSEASKRTGPRMAVWAARAAGAAWRRNPIRS